jgi:1,5-anhydro-D-fructose reductase (1,5-anhydro-D-mannitol-forming)
MTKILILGYGLIGKERQKAIATLNTEGYDIFCDIFDPVFTDLEISHEKNTNFFVDFNIVKNNNYDLVIIATPHDIAVDYAIHFIAKNIDILIEKPIGRNLIETEKIISKLNKSKIHVGFNYPYFEPISKLIKDCNENFFGELISVNLKMGHGNFPGIENTWKLSKAKAGGGCLIDPGIHLLDLLLIFFKSEIEVCSYNDWSGFWNTGIEEEVKIILKSKKTLIYVDISLVKWRSTFEIEFNGIDNYGRVSGRGRSYGPQSYVTGSKWSWQNGKSQAENEIIVESSDCSKSFYLELKDIINGRESNLDRAILGMKLLEKIRN